MFALSKNYGMLDGCPEDNADAHATEGDAASEAVRKFPSGAGLIGHRASTAAVIVNSSTKYDGEAPVTCAHADSVGSVPSFGSRPIKMSMPAIH
jgi:hypothetical protein